MLTVAIIGAGIGREHLAAYRQLPDRFRVKTLCDLDKKRAQEVLGDSKDIHIEPDFERVLADADIDLIDICLPPHLHLETCLQALNAGKNVICEKPLSSSIEDAYVIADKSETTGKQVFPVFQYRYGPGLTALRNLIKSGLAGKPLVASIETHWNRDAAYYDNPWRGTWSGEQGGAVLGHAIHNHDLLTSVFGPVDKLSAFNATRVNEIEVEDCASISFQMKNGALATSSITLGGANDTTRLRFCFENLTAESGSEPYAPADGDWSFVARGDASQSAIDEIVEDAAQSLSGFVGYFEAVANAIEGADDNAVTLEDGRRSLELVTAIYESSRKGAVIELPLTKNHPLYQGWMP